VRGYGYDVPLLVGGYGYDVPLLVRGYGYDVPLLVGGYGYDVKHHFQQYFSYIISWPSVLLVEETGVPGGNH